MNDNPDIPDEERGLYPKYRAVKIDSTDRTATENPLGVIFGTMHMQLEEVTEPFFLLKFSDPFARAALMAYAEACENTHPQLAGDIQQMLGEIEHAEGYAKLVGQDFDGETIVDTKGVVGPTEAEMNARIEALHGPGAVEAIEAAFEDGSIFAETVTREEALSPDWPNVGCPECYARKCQNCTGEAMDPSTYEMIECGCKMVGHGAG